MPWPAWAAEPPRASSQVEPVELEPVAPEPVEAEPEPEPDAAPEPEGPEPASPEGGQADSGAAAVPVVPAPEVTGELVRVAVGLAPDAPGTKEERALLDALEQTVRASTAPATQVRRLRVGSQRPSEICREGREDLVITVGYLPDRPAPVLLSRDCRLDLELGVRAGEAASAPGLVGALWDEHRQLVAAGARERRVGRISPRTRNILIAGGASVLIGVAVGFLVASILRDEEVVLTVSP